MSAKKSRPGAGQFQFDIALNQSNIISRSLIIRNEKGEDEEWLLLRGWASDCSPASDGYQLEASAIEQMVRTINERAPVFDNAKSASAPVPIPVDIDHMRSFVHQIGYLSRARVVGADEIPVGMDVTPPVMEVELMVDCGMSGGKDLRRSLENGKRLGLSVYARVLNAKNIMRAAADGTMQTVRQAIDVALDKIAVTAEPVQGNLGWLEKVTRSLTGVEMEEEVIEATEAVEEVETVERAEPADAETVPSVSIAEEAPVEAAPVVDEALPAEVLAAITGTPTPAAAAPAEGNLPVADDDGPLFIAEDGHDAPVDRPIQSSPALPYASPITAQVVERSIAEQAQPAPVTPEATPVTEATAAQSAPQEASGEVAAPAVEEAAPETATAAPSFEEVIQSALTVFDGLMAGDTPSESGETVEESGAESAPAQEAVQRSETIGPEYISRAELEAGLNELRALLAGVPAYVERSESRFGQLGQIIEKQSAVIVSMAERLRSVEDGGLGRRGVSVAGVTAQMLARSGNVEQLEAERQKQIAEALANGDTRKVENLVLSRFATAQQGDLSFDPLNLTKRYNAQLEADRQAAAATAPTAPAVEPAAAPAPTVEAAPAE